MLLVSMLAYVFQKMARYALSTVMYKHQHRLQSHSTPMDIKP